MDLTRPYVVLSPSLHADVLAVLAGTIKPLTGRQVGRLVQKGSQAGIHLALNYLVDQGIVLAEPAGRAILYQLNRNHVAASCVETLANLRDELLNRLRDLVSDWALQPLHLSIFGSTARGDGNTDSDIDVLVVRATEDPEDVHWRFQINQLAESVFGWTGNHAGIVELSTADISRLRQEQPDVIQEFQRDALMVFGEPISTLFPE